MKNAARETSVGGPRRDFPSTHWSTLLRLRDARSRGYSAALEALVEAYWKPAYHYVRALRHVAVEDAKDLTQSFFAMLLERRDLEKLSPERGSFRGFLKTALKNFLIGADRRRNARARTSPAFRFDEAEREWREACGITPSATPEEAFDREWACDVVLAAVARLEQELRARGKELAFALFREYCLAPAGVSPRSQPARLEPSPDDAPSYAELARRHNVSEDDVDNHLRAARQEMRRILREALAGYLGPGGNVEEELRFVFSR